MPYHIRKLPNKNKYKVYDNSGVATSNKPFTSREKAHKQIVAIHLSKLRRYGKSNVF